MSRPLLDLADAYELANKLHQLRTGRQSEAALELPTYTESRELIQAAVRIELFRLMGVRSSILDHTQPLLPLSRAVLNVLQQHQESMVLLFSWCLYAPLRSGDGPSVLCAFLKANNLAQRPDGTVDPKILPDRVMTVRAGQPVRRRLPPRPEPKRRRKSGNRGSGRGPMAWRSVEPKEQDW